MLVANQPEMNLGALKFGQEYSFKFVLKNTYTKPVTIVSVNAGCKSCTTASASKSIVPPNETVDINVKFVPGSTGMQSKNISVFHNVEGEIKPDVTLKFKSSVT